MPSTLSPIPVSVALACCGALAVLLTLRRPRFRAVAGALTGLAVIDLVLLATTGRPSPLGLCPSLFIAWYGIEAAAAGYVLARDKSPRFASAWGATAILVGLAWAWVAPYGEAIYTGTFATSLVIQVGSLGMFAARRPREVPTASELTMVILVVSSIFDALGPWITGHPRRDWPYGAWISLLTWAMLSGLETLWILTRERCSPPLDS